MLAGGDMVEVVVVRAGVREELVEAKALGGEACVGEGRVETKASGEVVDEWRSRGH